MRIAMWSGPRNLSTAMMYSFAARQDFAVWDEPFYAPYLALTGAEHPLAKEVLATHEADPAVVASRCAGPIPDAKAHWYQKHMPHHMVEGIPLDWAEDHVHVHLIRHPARVIASYAAKLENPTMEDVGFERQVQLFERFPGPVLDSFDVRQNPKAALERLCAEIGLGFDPAMLSWSAGPKPFDGVWAAHWYNAVHRSTGFAAPEGALPELTGDGAALAAAAMPHYEALAARKL